MKPRVCVTHDQVTGKSWACHGLITGWAPVGHGKAQVFQSSVFHKLGCHVKTRGFGQLQLQTRGFQIEPTIFQGFGSLGRVGNYWLKVGNTLGLC